MIRALFAAWTTPTALIPVVVLWSSALAAALLTWLAFLVTGYPLIRVTRVRAPLQLPLSLITGCGLLSLVVCLLSWAHLFTRPALLLVAAIGLILSGTLGWRDLRPNRPIVSRIRFGPWAFIVAAMVAFSVLAIYPAVTFDETMYHLPLSRLLIIHRGFVFDPFIRFSFSPQPNEAVYASVQMFGGSEAAVHLVEYSLLVALVWLIAGWFRARGLPSYAGAAAAIMLVASPMVVYVSTVANSDLWVLLFVTAGVMVAISELNNDCCRRFAPWLVVGFLLGQAATGKSIGSLAVAISAVALLVYGRRRVNVSAFAVGMLAVVLPWYARTFDLTGDPMYPLLQGLFGNAKGIWSDIEIAQMRSTVGGGGVLDRLSSAIDSARGATPHELPHGLVLISPFLLAAYARLAVRKWSMRRPTTILLLVPAVFVTSVVLWGSHNLRYQLPIVGLLAVATGLLVGDLGPTLSSAMTPRGRRFVWALVAGGLLSQSLLYTGLVLAENGPPPTSYRSLESLRAKRVECYTGLNYLNTRYGSDHVTYGFRCEQAMYFAKGRLIADHFGRGSYPRVFAGTTAGGTFDSGLLAARLRELEVEFLILNRRKPHTFERDILNATEFRLVFEDSHAAVLRLREATKRSE